MQRDNPKRLFPDDEAAKEVFDNYYRSKDSVVDKRRTQWKEYYKLYRSVIEVAKDDLVSQVVIPLVAITIEDIIPRIVANRPRIDAQPRHPEDIPRASKIRELLFYFWDFIPMAFKLIEFVKAAQIYGTALFKVVYKQQRETRMVRTFNQIPSTFLGIPIPGRTETVEEFGAQDILVYDDPWVDICEIDKIYPDPDGIDIESCSYIIHEIPVTLDELEGAELDGQPLYKQSVVRQLAKISDLSNQASQEEDESLHRMAEETFQAKAEPGIDPRKRQFTLLEQWKNNKITCVVKEFPQLPPVRNEFNPYGCKPFVRFTPIPDPNKFYGISVAETLHSMQVEISTLHSANIDNILYGVHQMFKVLRTSGINARNLRFRPGGVIPVKDMQDIQPLERNYQDLSLYRATDDIRRWTQRLGTTDTFAGVASDLTGRTATEASILSEASGSKAGLMFQILSVQTLNPLGKLVAKLYELYLSEGKSFKILGDEFIDPQFSQVNPQDIVTRTGMDLDITIDVAQTEPMNQQFALMRAKDMLQSFGAIGMTRQDPVVQYVLSEMLRAYGKNRPEALLGSPQGQQAAQLAAQAQLPTGGTAPPDAGDNVGNIAEQLAADMGG